MEVPRECSEETMFFTFLRAGFFVSLVRSTPHGRPMNNDSAKKSWECGRHVRQKEPAPSAEVRRTTPEVVRVPPDTSSYVAGVARGRGRARLRRASIVKRTATTRRHAKPLARRRCSEPRSCSQPVGRHASAVSSEGALRLCGRAGSVACASEFKPLNRPERARQREPRE